METSSLTTGPRIRAGPTIRIGTGALNSLVDGFIVREFDRYAANHGPVPSMATPRPSLMPDESQRCTSIPKGQLVFVPVIFVIVFVAPCLCASYYSYAIDAEGRPREYSVSCCRTSTIIFAFEPVRSALRPAELGCSDAEHSPERVSWAIPPSFCSRVRSLAVEEWAESTFHRSAPIRARMSRTLGIGG